MKSISEAIIKVMTEIEWVAKSMTVWTGTNAYKWVSDKDVRIVMRDAMIKNWLTIVPISVTPTIQVDRWEEDDTYWKQPPYPKKSKQSIFTEVVTKYLLIHTSGESIELAWYGQWVDSQDKGAGKATTYALKNTLLNMFLVPTWVDTDDTHSDDLPTPPKRTTESPTGEKRQFARTEADDLLDQMEIEDDIEHLKTIFAKLYNLGKSDKQKAFYESKYKIVKSRLEKRIWDNLEDLPF